MEATANPVRRPIEPASNRALLVLLRLLAALLLLPAGCSVWKTNETEPSSLPIAKMSPDAVSLEVAFLHVPTDDNLLAEPLWQSVDELHFPADARRRLAANGLRCGLLGSQMPLPWQKLFDSADQAAGSGLDGEVRNIRRRVQARSGKRTEVAASRTFDQLALLMTGQDGEVIGKTFRSANCLFAMKANAEGDGSVRLELVPELHHGEPKSEYVGQDGMFRLKVQRDREIFSDLEIEATLSPGQTLVIGANGDPTGLGKHFFTEENANGRFRQFLLIRLAHTQLDDLFAPVEQAAPIVTPVE